MAHVKSKKVKQTVERAREHFEGETPSEEEVLDYMLGAKKSKAAKGKWIAVYEGPTASANYIRFSLRDAGFKAKYEDSPYEGHHYVYAFGERRAIAKALREAGHRSEAVYVNKGQILSDFG